MQINFFGDGVFIKMPEDDDSAIFNEIDAMRAKFICGRNCKNIRLSACSKIGGVWQKTSDQILKFTRWSSWEQM